ncbi:type I-E CRISPR-associated protein Cse1/CasA [Actinosynnema sp. NPDC047251]|uniref:CRISPR-associated Cse1 family protein n=1 Tax=Saccharothrix espanaensis (strain ATCC 51144 / DSM 44229 / JCM 9112 / NBRC 15066 / NRRL 15764) TaxID=1179773 RepID=K0JUU9_SACES|nr:type I-E CRISPR-associated protein Cse1/CasA [Saccharothrix espanaensis]CCH29292.1 CRISPR-associated Cse1 family protein [Saccharothrix espanaensis DSM 44229]
MSGADFTGFDLIDRPWLLARTLTGDRVELPLLETVRQAHRLAGLVGEVPTQVFASTRLLLAVLHRAIDGPRDPGHWERLWSAAELPVDHVADYLDRHRDRFDLLDVKAPFMQVAGLHTAKDEVAELARLIADVPNGHPFFTNRLGEVTSLSFAEAARWIVHCHAFDPSGIKSGAVGDERVKQGKGYPIGTGWSGYLGGVLPEGRTLRDTLLLNLIPHSGGQGSDETDRPVWEREPVGPAEEVDGGRTPTGRVDLYTWQSRRIRLAHDGTRVTGVLICNGERITPQNKHPVEPHTAWRRSTAQEKKLRQHVVYMPREHDPEKAVWRGLQPMLPGAAAAQGSEAAPFLTPSVLEWIAEVDDTIGEDYPIRLHTIGMSYGPQSATTVEIVADSVRLHAVLLRRDAGNLVDTAVQCVRDAEAAARALGKLARNLGEAAGYRPNRKAGPGDRDGPRDGAVELAYATLDPLIRSWLWTLTRDTPPLEVHAVWHRTAWTAIHRLGSDMVGRAPLTAWAGRVVDGKRLMTSSHAHRFFLADLRAALPFSQTDTTEVTR